MRALIPQVDIVTDYDPVQLRNGLGAVKAFGGLDDTVMMKGKFR